MFMALAIADQTFLIRSLYISEVAIDPDKIFRIIKDEDLSSHSVKKLI